MVYTLLSIHPNAGLALGVNSVLPSGGTDKTVSTLVNWDGYNWAIATLVMLVSGSIYLGLYLFNERVKKNLL